jgi:release factor glutamine methyltransferase
MTVLEAITKGAEFLERKGVDSPRLQSELLLAHILNLPRLRLYLEFERALKTEQSDAFRELLVKRGNRAPLQHLTGSTSFCGCPILCTSAVLIPRPETESLAEAAWNFLNQLNRPATLLDVGTGSACIPIAIVAHAKNARATAVDISDEALVIARQNVEKNNFTDRIELRQSNLFSALNPEEKFDLIVSNPPYIASAEIETLQAEVRDHDPRLALNGGADGLDFYRSIAAEAPKHLAQGGQLMVEFGDGQAESLRVLFTSRGWTVLKILRDLSQRDRILIAAG